MYTVIFYLWSLKLIDLKIQKQQLNTEINRHDIDYLYDQLYGDGYHKDVIENFKSIDVRDINI